MAKTKTDPPEETQEEKLGKEAAKVHTKYEENVKTIEALFNNSPILKGKAKIGKASREILMIELFAEEEKEAGEQFKIKAKALVKRKIALDKFIIQKKKEFDEAVTAEKKAVNKDMDECFALLDAVQKMKEEFAASAK